MHIVIKDTEFFDSFIAIALELEKSGVDRPDLKPALLLQAQCKYDLLKECQKSEGVSESDENAAFLSFIDSIIKTYGSDKLPQLGDGSK